MDETKPETPEIPIGSWVVVEREGPITLNTTFVINQVTDYLAEPKVTEGTDEKGNPRTYVVGAWKGFRAAPEQAQNTNSYFNLVLLSRDSGTAISGAAMWDYGDEANPAFVGTSNSEGKLTFLNATGSSKFRIIARGFAIKDITVSKGEGILSLSENPPAAYGGITGGALSSIWESTVDGSVIQFTAHGLMRRAPTLKALSNAQAQQYGLAGTRWLPSMGPEDFSDTPFYGFNTRSHIFRANGGGWTQPIAPHNGFSFPEPGKMLGRKERGGPDEFVLLG
ncbi:MAG: hypothetical protein AAF382_14135 [Pseudomonadota bacterium]